MKRRDALSSLCAAGDPASRKIYDAYRKFQAENDRWSDISERAYQRALKL